MDIARLNPLRRRRPRVPVIRLQGAIGAVRPTGGGLSDAALAPLLEHAFRRGRPAAVALVINSPGGSPVQSSLIAARIRRLADETAVPVLAFVEDIAASGGYWLASAADEIWADATSLIGSIGVISSGFGFAGLLERHGVERRVHTAGASKSFMDPFRPEKPEDVARLHALLRPLHAAFKTQVTARRGGKLTATQDLFTGDVWAGEEAVVLGLIDGIGHMVPVLKARFGDKLRMVPYQIRRPLLRRFGVGAMAAAAMDAGFDAAEERALWSRYGF
jgi:serine protease SohB